MTDTTAQMPGPEPSASPSTTPLFIRPRAGRIVAGVCAGIAKRWQLDVTLVRIAAVVLTLFSGVGFVAYVVAWLLTPSVDGPAPLAPDSELARRIGRRGGSLVRRLPKLLLIVLLAALLLAVAHTLWFGVPLALLAVAAVLVAAFGTRAGRWTVGILAALLALSIAVVGIFGTRFGSRSITVTSVSDLHSSYDYGAGKLALDLSSLSIAGRHHTDVRMGRGDVTLSVPHDVAVIVHAHAGVGSVSIENHKVSGIDVEQTKQVGPGTTSDEDRLTIDVEVGAGSISIQ